MADTKPLISVIVPVYNGERYVEDCIHSLMKQTYDNLEIILVNDGSTDQSKEIIEKLYQEDKRIVLLHQINQGVSEARNLGLSYARGEFISFVDADDWVSEEYLSYLYRLVKRYNADISLVPHAQIFSGSVNLAEEILDASEAYETKLWTGREAARQLLLYRVKMSCWCKLFRRSYLEGNKIRFEKDLFCGEGFNFNIDCFLKAKKVAVGYKPIYFYRIDNPRSAMTGFNIHLIENGLKAIDYIDKKVIKLYPELQNELYFIKWHTCCDFLNMIIGCNQKRNYMDYYKYLKRECRRLSIYAIREGTFRDRCKGMIFGVSPDFAANVINVFRPRKFKHAKKIKKK